MCWKELKFSLILQLVCFLNHRIYILPETLQSLCPSCPTQQSPSLCLLTRPSPSFPSRLQRRHMWQLEHSFSHHIFKNHFPKHILKLFESHVVCFLFNLSFFKIIMTVICVCAFFKLWNNIVIEHSCSFCWFKSKNLTETKNVTKNMSKRGAVGGLRFQTGGWEQ